MTRPRVMIETPYRATAERSLEMHRLYLLHCMADSWERGEAPMASHFFYTEILDDEDPKERMEGILAGYRWGDVADYVAYYCDLGISPGMSEAILYYEKTGKRIERRKLSWDVLKPILDLDGIKERYDDKSS